MDTLEDMRPFSPNINKRPNKGRSHTRGRSIHSNEHTGISISKQVIPANQLKNPTWDSESRQWIEGNDDPPVYEKESRHPFSATSQIHGDVGTGIQISRMVSSSKITPWREKYIGPPDKSRPYSRQLSHLRNSTQFKKRGGTHKRKNKHTRRRRVQRRRLRA